MLKNKELEHRRQHGKMESIRKKKEVYGVRRRTGSHRRSRLGVWLVVIALGCACLVGCTTLKKAGVTSLGAGGGAIVGSVLSSGAIAPILGATTGAFVTDVVTETMITKKASGTILQTEAGMIECAPDNLWSLLEKLVGVGGWFLILIFVVPMLLGWILPGPLTTHGKKRKSGNLFS
jgi:hypothetical protein